MVERFHSGGRQAGVVGLGRSGVAAARFIAALGHPVLACDDQPDPPRAAALKGVKGVTLATGGLDGEALARCGVVLLSPGIRRTHPAVAHAALAGVPVINDVEYLYLWDRAAGRRTPFIGITGTNGKSTVTTLVGEMLAHAGRLWPVGGNLGRPALELADPDAAGYVLELSSYQLESVVVFRAHVGVLLNVTPDHLDRYAGLDGYRAAKLRLFANQRRGDWAVINGDDPLLEGARERLRQGPAVVTPVSLGQALPGGVYCGAHDLVDAREGTPLPILPLGEIRIPGRHNRFNAAAAAAAALHAGAGREAVAAVLRAFPGLPHRMEWVRRLDGVDWYNDSKGTNVGAVVESLGSFSGGVVLIAGGRDKAGDFTPLMPLLKARVTSLILLGEAAEVMERALAGSTRIVRVGSLQEAVAEARLRAAPGGVVLLSPACASQDMFADFEQRGERFKEAVHAL